MVTINVTWPKEEFEFKTNWNNRSDLRKLRPYLKMKRQSKYECSIKGNKWEESKQRASGVIGPANDSAKPGRQIALSTNGSQPPFVPNFCY
ncbi:hypothetical protein J6590_023666 [Homalodisca vitripennis]|nr:hypothetical protein J6590_023666 [Homalodisca vitripennis]